MRRRVLIKRYSLGLLSTLQKKEDYLQVEKDLLAFQSLLTTKPEIQHFLTTPFLPVKKRLAITQELLDKILSFPLSPKKNRLSSAISARFIRLLVENDRLSLLPEILETLPHLWNEEHDISTFEVASVIPLSSSQKGRLEQKLSRIEGREVALNYKIDPSLIGGLSVKRNNIIYDVSIAGGLARLKEKICEG